MKYLNYLFAFLLIGSVIACDKEEEEVEPETDAPEFTLEDATEITTNSAFVSGSVSGDDVKDVGFVYGTSSALSENSAKLQIGEGPQSISSFFPGLSDNTTYFYAAYATNTDGDFFKSVVKSFKTEEIKKLALGDEYQGGIIYYLDGSGEHGLLASPVNVTTGSNWQTAYDACYAYELQGNSDWRLPNLSELEDLYAKKSIVGGFADIAYWSRSVEGSNPTLAYGVYFGGGSDAGKSFVYDKTGTYQYSRAIRDF